MEQSILLADPRFIFRQGLRNFLTDMFRHAVFEEAGTSDYFKLALSKESHNLVIVNQSFLIALSRVPDTVSIILASQPDREIFLAAHAYGAKAYLSSEPDEHLLRFALHCRKGSFCVDPI